MGTIEKILNILKMKNEPKSYSVKFYAEKKLDDGRVIATEDEQFTVGSKVFAISDDGDAHHEIHDLCKASIYLPSYELQCN